jgi:hypothetical protein
VSTTYTTTTLDGACIYSKYEDAELAYLNRHNPNYSELRAQEERERLAWEKQNLESIATVYSKLLAIGGRRVSNQENPDIDLLAKGGILFEGLPIIMMPGLECRCHENVDWLWENREPNSPIVATFTGYGLIDDDGVWRPHSWAMHWQKGVMSGHNYTALGQKGVLSIVETTVVRDKYFGSVTALDKESRL